MGVLSLIGCSENTPTSNQNISSEIAFTLCEGSFQANDASLHGLNEDALLLVTGDTGSSMAVYNNQLLVVNNGSSNVVIYNISTEGIVEYASTIELNGSSPREILVVGDKAYISQWVALSIAVIDLKTLSVEQIEMPGCTEGLTTDDTYLYATIKYLNNTDWPYPAGNTIEKINLSTNLIENSFSVSNNPDIVIYHNGFLFVGSQYGDWQTYNFVTEKINPTTGELSGSKDHGSDVAFGVDFSIHNDVLYRAYDKGIVALNDDLSVNISTYIGTEYSGLYSMAINEDSIYLGFGDYTAPDNVIIIDFNGNEIANYEVGANPGSFAFWKSD